MKNDLHSDYRADIIVVDGARDDLHLLSKLLLEPGASGPFPTANVRFRRFKINAPT